MEPAPEQSYEPEQIVAYHNGRCLTGGGKPAAVVQNICCDNAKQRWYLRPAPEQRRRIENSLSGHCLTSLAVAVGNDTRVAEAVCRPDDVNQQWRPNRLGNTFQFISNSGRCLEVMGQSRADGVAIREAACSGAANQLWSVESLRHLDYETLFQADKNRYQWQAEPSQPYPYPAEVEPGSGPVP